MVYDSSYVSSAFVLHCHGPKYTFFLFIYFLILILIYPWVNTEQASITLPYFWWSEVTVVMSPPVLFTAWWQYCETED